MSTATTITRRINLRAGLIVTLVATFLAALAPATAQAAVDSSAEAQFVSLINQERAARGLAKLTVKSDLVQVARNHSADMAAKNDLYHNPNLGSDVTGWQKVGENVGRGPSVSSIHDAFMNSSGHRANILDSDWTEVGVGVHVVDGRVWVTEVFRQPSGSSSTQETSSDDSASEDTSSDSDDSASKDTSKDTSEASNDTSSSDNDAPASAPSADASADQSGQGSAEGSEGPAPLPALQDRALSVLHRVDSVESGS